MLAVCCAAGHMTLHDGAEMAEGGDRDECNGNINQFAAVNGHIGDDDHTVGSSDFASSILGHPSTILIVTNVADATFVSAEVRVPHLFGFTLMFCKW